MLYYEDEIFRTMKFRGNAQNFACNFVRKTTFMKGEAGYSVDISRNNQLSRFLYSIEAFIKRNHATKLRFVESILNGMFFRNHATKMQGEKSLAFLLEIQESLIATMNFAPN